MSLTLTYNQLRTMMTDWTDNDNDEYTNAQDRIIALSELKLLRELDLNIFDVEDGVTVSTAVGVNTIARPGDMISEMNIGYTKNGAVINFETRQYSWIKEFNAGATSNPLYYAVKNEDQWIIAPTPDAIYALTIEYIKRPAGLDSVTNTMTWLSTHAADLLLYACLVNSEEFVESSEMLQTWKQKYAELMETAKGEFRELMRRRY